MPLAGRTKPCHSLDGRTKPCHSRAGRSHATRVSRSSADAEQPQLSPRPKQPQGVQAASHLRPRPRPSKAHRHPSAWGRESRGAAPRRSTRTSARALATAGSRIATTCPSGSSSFRGAGPPTPARPGALPPGRSRRVSTATFADAPASLEFACGGPKRVEGGGRSLPVR